jgi:hypothetical protein
VPHAAAADARLVTNVAFHISVLTTARVPCCISDIIDDINQNALTLAPWLASARVPSPLLSAQPREEVGRMQRMQSVQIFWLRVAAQCLRTRTQPNTHPHAPPSVNPPS